MLSIIVPAYNEAESVAELYAQVSAACIEIGTPWEIVFVDDGSTDDTSARIAALMARDPRVGSIRFRRNFGKAAALDAGFRMASGDVVMTMDADLQDDPAEIGKFLKLIDDGYDVVSGWKQVRHDPVDKTLPSKIFNWLVQRVSGLKIHDNNCGFKAYRAEALRDLTLYGEMHRFIPVLLHWRGFRVGEMVVHHRPRKFGKTKYRMDRFLKGIFDLLTVSLLTRYVSRPLHIFGLCGVALGSVGFVILSYLVIAWLLGQSIGTRPLLFLGLLLMVLGAQFISTGLLAEFVQRHQLSDPLRYFVARHAAPSQPAAAARLRSDDPAAMIGAAEGGSVSTSSARAVAPGRAE